MTLTQHHMFGSNMWSETPAHSFGSDVWLLTLMPTRSSFTASVAPLTEKHDFASKVWTPLPPMLNEVCTLLQYTVGVISACQAYLILTDKYRTLYRTRLVRILRIRSYAVVGVTDTVSCVRAWLRGRPARGGTPGPHTWPCTRATARAIVQQSADTSLSSRVALSIRF